jgi:hypothetical protein
LGSESETQEPKQHGTEVPNYYNYLRISREWAVTGTNRRPLRCKRSSPRRLTTQGPRLTARRHVLQLAVTHDGQDRVEVRAIHDVLE